MPKRIRPELYKQAMTIVVYCLTDLIKRPDRKVFHQSRSNWTNKIYKALLKASNFK